MHQINPNYKIGYVEFHLEHTYLLREAYRLFDFSQDMNRYFIVNVFEDRSVTYRYFLKKKKKIN